ncbi:MAG: YbaN family protein [Coriobacteriia bacterium]
MGRMWRWTLVAVGSLSLAAGIIGMFVPMWPTTPFLLLAAACYVRSSERLYGWLIEHRHLGPYILDFRTGRGIPLRVKVVVLGLMWITTVMSSVMMVSSRDADPFALAYAFVVMSAAVGVQYYVGFRIPTRAVEDEAER